MELGWLQELLKEYKQLRLVSLCFDESKETALKTLRSALGPSSMVPVVLDKFGLNLADSADPIADLIRVLGEKAQVPVDRTETRSAVLKTLAALGVDRQSIRAVYQPFEAALGPNAVLHMVPADLHDDLLTALGLRGGLPLMLVLDSQGVVKAKGYVSEEKATALVKELIAPDAR
jgi:hypothetical protein